MLVKDKILNFDIDKKVTELQWQSIKLKEAIIKLPDSMIRSILLSSVAKEIKLSRLEDFYLVRSRIATIISIVEENKSFQEILKMLEEIKNGLKRVIRCLENKTKGKGIK